MIDIATAPKAITLGEARSFVTANLGVGVVCPCCDQLAKRYRRKLNAGIVRALLVMFGMGAAQRWVHASDVVHKLRVSPEISKLVWWGLAEEQEIEDKDSRKKKHKGFWKLTAKGIAFAKGEVSIPKYAEAYNKAWVIDDQSELTSVREALGDEFDYEELMQSAAQY